MVVVLKNCFYCGVETVTARKGKKTPLPDNFRTKDHMIPKSRGGKQRMGNTVICCNRCNREKGCLTFEEYKVVFALRKQLIMLTDVKIFAGERYGV